MKKYMVISLVDGETGAFFTDSFQEAENYRMNGECGVGAYCEVYERMLCDEEHPEEGYEYKMIF